MFIKGTRKSLPSTMCTAMFFQEWVWHNSHKMISTFSRGMGGLPDSERVGKQVSSDGHQSVARREPGAGMHPCLNVSPPRPEGARAGVKRNEWLACLVEPDDSNAYHLAMCGHWWYLAPLWTEFFRFDYTNNVYLWKLLKKSCQLCMVDGNEYKVCALISWKSAVGVEYKVIRSIWIQAQCLRFCLWICIPLVLRSPCGKFRIYLTL